jgi:H+/Cl- antiporter ClcA
MARLTLPGGIFAATLVRGAGLGLLAFGNVQQ